MYQIGKAIRNLKKLCKAPLLTVEDITLIKDTVGLLERAEIQLGEQGEKYCHWYQQDFEECETWLCCDDKLFNVLNGTPNENGMIFCPYCGKNIIEHSYSEQFKNEDDEDYGYEDN